MSKLICDICGTSYSDDVEKCPTCGYSRAFEEPVPEEARVPAVREKVRGGRFSKKNVRKRLEMLAKSEQKSLDHVLETDLAEELSAVTLSEIPRMPSVPAPVAQEHAAVQEPETEPVIVLMPEAEEPAREEAVEEETEPENEPIFAVLPEAEESVWEEAVTEEAEPEAEPIVIVLPEEEEPAEEEAVEEASEPEAEPIVIVFPEEEEPAGEEAAEATEPETEPIVLALPEEEEPVQEEAAEEIEPETEIPAVVPVVIPDEESGAQEEVRDEDEPEEEPEKKKKGGWLLNVVLYTSVAVFLAAAIYLLVSYGIPYLKDMDWPTQPVAETTMPTEEPTQAPTDAPTEAPTDPPTEPPTDPPTDPPTEAPTDPPTDPPTEAPTEPLLDVKLELNYYDLTFGAPNQGTQLEANIIPNEDITWISDDPSIVTISETGKIISISGGRTTVRAIYGDQEVTVKINCGF